MVSSSIIDRSFEPSTVVTSSFDAASSRCSACMPSRVTWRIYLSIGDRRDFLGWIEKLWESRRTASAFRHLMASILVYMCLSWPSSTHSRMDMEWDLWRVRTQKILQKWGGKGENITRWPFTQPRLMTFGQIDVQHSRMVLKWVL